MLAALGIVRGQQDTGDADGDGDTTEHLYFAKRVVTRGEMSAFLARELRLQVEEDNALPGGARVDLAAQQAGAGQDVDGTVVANKTVELLTADGCGLDGEDVTVTDGAFTVSIPEGQPAGDCDLALTAVTARSPDGPTQTVTYTFEFSVQ